MSERTIDDILSEFANASVECEEVQLGMSRREQIMRADELRAELNERFTSARREVETVNEEAERQAGVICNLNTDLATSRAALEDVRRVEQWMLDNRGYHTVAADSQGGIQLYEASDPIMRATGIVGLGRALAQEAGDAK